MTDAPSGGSRSATVYDYADGSGGVVEQRIPPTSWNPTTATDQELLFYGFPARPTGAAALSEWAARYNNFSGVVGSGICINKNLSHTTDQHWAGTKDTSHSNYNYIEANVKVPHDIFACPHASGNSLWTGIGASLKVLQNGIRDEDSTANSWKWWYEAIDYGVADTRTVDVAGVSASPAQTMQFITNYFKDTNGKMSIEFFWYDVNNGKSASLFTQTLAGHPITDFYDGAAVEAITERVIPLDLRKWDSGNVLFSSAHVQYGSTAADLLSLPHVNYNMVGNHNSTPVATWVANGTSTSSFYVRHETACE